MNALRMPSTALPRCSLRETRVAALGISSSSRGTAIPTCRRCVATQASKSGGSGVLDGPTTTAAPSKSVEKVFKKYPSYKVMLHNDSYNRREYVVKVLLKIVGITVDDAVVVMQEAHESGVAMVVACAQDKAEAYTEGLRLNGLTASMEPGC